MGLRFGLVGSGLAGPLFAGALAQRPGGSNLQAVATRHEASARSAAEKWGVPRWYADWRQLLDDADIDAVCVATPTGTHAEIAIAAARAGKHVLTEKPMATTVADADAMISACRDARVTLGVIFMYRYMDTAMKMKQAIVQGWLGRPVLGEVVGKFFRDQAYYDSADGRGNWGGEGGGSLMTQTSHTLDLLIWMLGDVQSVAGFWTTTGIHKIEVEDLAVAALRFESGALASVISSTAITPPSERTLTIHGETGTVGLSGDRLARWDVPGPADAEAAAMVAAPVANRGDTAAKAGYVDAELHRRQISDFVAAVNEGRSPAVDGWEGRRTLEVMQAIYDSGRDTGVIQIQSGERPR